METSVTAFCWTSITRGWFQNTSFGLSNEMYALSKEERRGSRIATPFIKLGCDLLRCSYQIGEKIMWFYYQIPDWVLRFIKAVP